MSEPTQHRRGTYILRPRYIRPDFRDVDVRAILSGEEWAGM